MVNGGPDDAVSRIPILTSAQPRLARSGTPRMTADLRIQRVPITHPDAQLLVEAVQEEYVARYGGRDESPITPEDFDDPRGQFFVGYVDDVPVTTGAWRRSTVIALGVDVTAEIKRMYVVPDAPAARHRAADARAPRVHRRGRRDRGPGARRPGSSSRRRSRSTRRPATSRSRASATTAAPSSAARSVGASRLRSNYTADLRWKP